MNTKIQNSLSQLSGIPLEKNQEIFNSITSNEVLVDSFTKLSSGSPIFQRLLKDFKRDLIDNENKKFIETCNNFYKGVSTISEEMPLIVDSTYSKFLEKDSFSEDKEKNIKSLLGTAIYLLLTSNSNAFDLLEAN